jgi:hypothetical protein
MTAARPDWLEFTKFHPELTATRVPISIDFVVLFVFSLVFCVSLTVL